MSQRNAKQRSKRAMSQPPIVANPEESSPPLNDVPQSSPPPTSHVRRELHDSDSEHTNSASSSNVPTPPTRNSDPSSIKIAIRPQPDDTLVPNTAHREIMPCITWYFPDAIKSFKHAPRPLKDMWFNEFRNRCEWDPSDEAAIRNIFEKLATKRLPDKLWEVRARLDKGKPQPKWMSDSVLAQFRRIWDTEDFKKTAEKNKKNRNSDCGGMGPLLHSAGSIPMSEHRRRLGEKLGEDPSHAVLFQATHKRKNTDEFVCRKAKHVMDTATQQEQTQPEVGVETAWIEAAGGIKKRGCVAGFGSVTPHYFPEATRQRKSRTGESSSHLACQEEINRLKEENKRILEQFQRLKSQFAVLSANPQRFKSTDPNLHRSGSQEGSGDDFGLDDDTQPPLQSR